MCPAGASTEEGGVSKGRLEAFSDGVVAILITIMVLELKVPQGSDLQALAPLGPVFLSYVLSFVNLGIYWANHHHLFQAAKVVDGRVLWANLHLLFWLSLFPFGTAWMGDMCPKCSRNPPIQAKAAVLARRRITSSFTSTISIRRCWRNGCPASPNRPRSSPMST